MGIPVDGDFSYSMTDHRARSHLNLLFIINISCGIQALILRCNMFQVGTLAVRSFHSLPTVQPSLEWHLPNLSD
jgi:hypothetical protein